MLCHPGQIEEDFGLHERDERSKRQRAAHTDDKVRVAIVGVGNCANSFIQGVHYYKDADPADEVPGLMHVDLGGYHVRDVEFVAAFDIDAEKVGKDLSEAIWSGQNNTIKFADVPELGVEVQRGMTHDGLGKYLKEKITKAPGETADVVGILKETKADVLVCYLPVGSEDATKWYVEQALTAGVGVRQLPAGLHRPRGLLGQALRGGRAADHRRRHQVPGRRDDRPPPARAALPRPRRADRAHLAAQRRRQHGLLQHARARAARLEEDLEDQRRHLDHGPRAAAEDVHVGPSDYVAWLTDRKWAHIRLEGKAFGDVPLNVELKLEVWDSPNSAGVVIDAVRIIKLALNNGIAGQLDGPSSYLMKSPHTQRPDDEAREQTEEFISTYARGKSRSRRPAGERRDEGRGLIRSPPRAGSYAACSCRLSRSR